MKSMKQWMFAAILLFSGLQNLQAQRIQVVDAKGSPIALASVITHDGVLIGNTDLNGVLDDVKGNAKVTVTHVAYKPQTVTLSSIPNGRITMEEVDYGIAEIVVTPKPYIYVETYYRAYGYINDSLTYFRSGPLANAYDVKKKKIERGGIWGYGSFARKGTGKGMLDARVDNLHAGQISSAAGEKMFTKDKWKKYGVEIVPDGANRKLVNLLGKTYGHVVYANGQSRMTLDAGNIQMATNRIDGKDRLLKRREEMDYDYQFTQIYRMDEDGDMGVEDFVMEVDHWEWNSKKGHEKLIIECYAVEHDYITKDDFKKKKKEINGDYVGDKPFSVLMDYERKHNIPAMAPELRKIVETLKNDDKREQKRAKKARTNED